LPYKKQLRRYLRRRKEKKKKKKKKNIAACFKTQSLSRFGHVQKVPYIKQLRRYLIANL